MMWRHGPEWDSEMVCSECGMSWVSTRYVELTDGRRVRLCPECIERRKEVAEA